MKTFLKIVNSISWDLMIKYNSSISIIFNDIHGDEANKKLFHDSSHHMPTYTYFSSSQNHEQPQQQKKNPPKLTHVSQNWISAVLNWLPDLKDIDAEGGFNMKSLSYWCRKSNSKELQKNCFQTKGLLC